MPHHHPIPSEDHLHGRPAMAPSRCFIEPEEEEEKWTTWARLQTWLSQNSRGYDLFDDMHNGGHIPVGTLRGTDRMVYASVAFADGDRECSWATALKFENGAYRVRLIATPFSMVGTLAWACVTEAELSNVHSLAGFHATAEIFDWDLVEFKRDCRSESGNILGTYVKILKKLQKFVD